MTDPTFNLLGGIIGRVIITIARMRCLVDSPVLDSRSIPNKKVTKEHFIENYKRVNARDTNQLFNPRRVNVLKKRWSTILGRCTWGSSSPESYQLSLAALAWARLLIVKKITGSFACQS